MQVFTADKIEINFGEKSDTFKNVKIGVSPQKINCAVLHPDLLEDINVCAVRAGAFELFGYVNYKAQIMFYKLCLCSLVAALQKRNFTALLLLRKRQRGVKIHTVAGSKIMQVFTADKIEINFGEKQALCFCRI